VRFDDQAAAQAHKRWQAAARRAARERLRAIEAIEAIEQEALAGAVPEPAAVRMVQALAPRATDEDEDLDALVARSEALVLEMSRRLAG
jgi:hypothetical protein